MSENFTPRQQRCMDIYDAIVNNVTTDINHNLDSMIAELGESDDTGQFLTSAARFLTAIDFNNYAKSIERLVELAIPKDRERRYIGSLLEAIWGPDYKEKALTLRESDDNFRRIYKRIYPSEYLRTTNNEI